MEGQDIHPYCYLLSFLFMQEVMRDPVVAADGFTYEKEHIAKWMENCSLSPSTGLPLAHMCLTPNNALKTLLQSHTFH